MARVNGFRDIPDDDDDGRLGAGRRLPRRSRTPQPRQEYRDGYGTGYGLAPPPDGSWGSGGRSQQNGNHPRRHSFNGGPVPAINIQGPSRERSPSPYSTEYPERYHRHVPSRRYSEYQERTAPTSRGTSPSPSSQLSQVGDTSGAAPPQPAPSPGTSIPGVLPSSQAPGDGTFKHQALQENQFRLLRILPEASSIVKCEVFTAALDEPPPYKAISYAWGDADNTQKIEINGAKVDITASLHGALKALRQKTEVVVWADGLCINQHDKEERSKQVKLMVLIYQRAQSVAIWLGPDADNSRLAFELLEDIADAYKSNSLEALKAVVRPSHRRSACLAVVSLFERDYWERLWVVQEVFNANTASVHCGDLVTSWELFKVVREVFKRYEKQLKPFFVTDWNDDDQQRLFSRNPLRYSHVLTQGGPSSFPDVRSLMTLGDRTLLEVLRACRPKLAADPRDKVYAILGLLPDDISDQFIPNYSSSPTDVYINVVDFLLTTTHRLDVICEAIHYPVHVSSIRLPSWVPNWSQIPHRELLSRSYRFNADNNTRVQFRYLDTAGKKIENAGSIIEIQAIELDTIRRRGIPVDVLNELDSYLMSFLHWWALLLENHDDDGHDAVYTQMVRDAFCRTLCLDHLPKKLRLPCRWTTACCHVFASLIRKRLPHIVLDDELQHYADLSLGLGLKQWKDILNEVCHDSMKGRSFCVTEDGLMGLGSGFMAVGDVVVVPLGCHTPIILRKEGNQEKHYRYVGDIYIDEYMDGKAVDELEANKRRLKSYVLR